MTKQFQFRTSSAKPGTSNIYTVDLRNGVSIVNQDGKQLGGGYSVQDVERYVANKAWIIVKDLETGNGVDADGTVIKFRIEDIKDFMRVVVGGNTFIVFTNARSPDLSLYITNGSGKNRKLNFNEVTEVYSQPEFDLLSPSVFGKLKFRRTDVSKLVALQDAVAKAEAELAAAKAALAAGK